MTTTRVAPARSGAPAPGAPARPSPRSKRRVAWTRRLLPWLFLLPALILFAVFKFVPMARAIEMSFHEVRPYLGDRWVGGENYSQVVTDEAFRDAIWHTIVLAVGQTGGSLAIGLLLALLLEGAARHLWFVRTAVFLPTVAAMAVVAEVWRVIYYPAPDGMLNNVLSWFGMGPSQFLNAEDTSLWSVMAVGIWRGAPYDMMIFIAGLAGVDRTLYEAAAADGAGPMRRFWHVTMPALRPVFAILFTLAAIRGLRVFTEIFLLTNGGPNGSTEVLMTLIYKLGLERNELGVAAAGSMVLLGATVVLTLAVQAFRRKDSR
ncbi:carbohydrate ABC transporter permease [Spirilliplanes yamanashiensis]|uniref:Sugar ABC transporter permease n=1 Tax=Spirilliplanes yamanashiensis TaxID=42233 RepID=A0A8J3YCQ3_9ACTN|nr:sugar ABC transporter permease [Spirilliplanes yamanashiensis]MDP9819044.1 multiple sugar transport system permease protein [Spirilliplanes yamanashiensis]GIJ05499.1 sugar ABC transporter permease [Spirilliplanes yamanashiensis]